MCNIAFGLPGGTELYVIAFVVLLLFGKQIPKVMRGLGQGINELRKGLAGDDDDGDIKP